MKPANMKPARFFSLCDTQSGQWPPISGTISVFYAVPVSKLDLHILLVSLLSYRSRKRCRMPYSSKVIFIGFNLIIITIKTIKRYS